MGLKVSLFLADQRSAGSLRETQHRIALLYTSEQFFLSHFWGLVYRHSRSSSRCTLNTCYVSSSTLGAVVATKVNKNRPLAFKNICPFKLKVCAPNYKTEGPLLKDSGFGLDQRVQQTADHGLNPTYHLFLYSPQVKWFLHFRMIGEKIKNVL